MGRGRTRARHDRGCRGCRGWLPCHWTGARDRRADPGLYLCRSPAAFVTSCRCERTLFGLGRCRRPRVYRRRSPRSSPCSASPDGGAAASITASAWSKATVSSSAVRAATILCVLRVFALLRSCLHVVRMRSPWGLGWVSGVLNPQPGVVGRSGYPRLFLLVPPAWPHRVLDRLIRVTAVGRPVRPVPYAGLRLQTVPVDHAVRPFGYDGAPLVFRLAHECLALAEAHLPAVLGLGHGWSHPLFARAAGHVASFPERSRLRIP